MGGATIGKAQLQGRISGRVTIYQRANSRASVRVIAMHGALRSASDLSLMVERFPTTDLWLIDLPGHGNTPFVQNNGGFDPETLAHDISLAIASEPSAAPVVILGESFSGIIALRLAARLANVRHVILLDTPLDTTRMLPAQRVVLSRWESLPQQRAFLETLAIDFFGLDIPRRQVTPRSYVGELVNCQVNVTMLTGSVKQKSATGIGAFFAEMDQRALAEARHVRVIAIANVGHSLLRVQPQATLDAIADVLRQLDGPLPA